MPKVYWVFQSGSIGMHMMAKFGPESSIAFALIIHVTKKWQTKCFLRKRIHDMVNQIQLHRKLVSSALSGLLILKWPPIDNAKRLPLGTFKQRICTERGWTFTLKLPAANHRKIVQRSRAPKQLAFDAEETWRDEEKGNFWLTSSCQAAERYCASHTWL